MAEFPVPLDNLIAYVKTLHPEGGPLENVSDAFAVSEQLDEQSDALLGYFVDQARRSGLSWSQIGAAMGVSKQAAQKRFVPGQASIQLRDGRPQDVLPLHRPRHPGPVRRRPPRRRPPGRRIAARRAGGERGPPRDQRGAAGRRVPLRAGRAGGEGHRQAGLTAEQVYAAVGAGPAPQLPNRDRASLSELTFDDSAKATFREALKWALRMGHNYIGTEHLLLGVLFTGGPVAEAFTSLGLTPQRAEELITAELTDYVSAAARSAQFRGTQPPRARARRVTLRGRLFASPCLGS